MSAPDGVIDLRAIVADAVAPLAAKIDALTAEVAALRDRRGDELLSVEAAADVIGTSPAALRKKIARGTVRVVRVGRSVRLRRADVVGGSDGR